MKKIFAVAALVGCVFNSFSQLKVASCCVSAATDQFVVLASDKSFIQKHDNPLPYVYKSDRGMDIGFKAADGTAAHGWFVKAGNPSPYVLFVIHEWWGLNDYIKQESEKLSNDLGINVLAIDLYDNKVATDQQQASQYVREVSTDRAQAIIKGAYTYVGDSVKVFTIGWCFGGGWSLQAALMGKNQAEGCVMYYGMPEQNVDVLNTLQCYVLGIFANQDGYITPAVVDEFKENMNKAGKKLILERYDADHAFANPSNPHFQQGPAVDAYAKTLVFLKERMK